MHEFLCLLLRHGQTPRTLKPEYRGQSDGDEDKLDANGLKEIRESAAFISRLPLEIKYVISSDMQRTEETSDIVCEVLGLKEFHIDERLRPLDVGDFVGKNKDENPITQYLDNPSEKFPNGESVSDFENRQYAFAKSLFGWLEYKKLAAGSVLVVCHDDVIGYWLETQKKNPSVKYLGEKPDVVKPGGIVLVTSGEVIPIHGRNNPNGGDGTALSGFVTAIENLPPRECWNCRFFSRDIVGTGQCGNSIVRIDPELPDWQRQADGHVIVEDDSCCNEFSNHPST